MSVARRAPNGLAPCLGLLLALLCGCTSLAPRPGQALRNPALASNWLVSGKASLYSGENRWSGGFQWRQSGDDFELTLKDALGRTALRVTQKNDQANLHAATGEHRQGVSASELLQGTPAENAPIPLLPYWLRGLTDKSGGQAPPAQATSFNSGDWRLVIRDWQSIDGWRLPHRLSASQPGTTIKIVVKQWRVYD